MDGQLIISLDNFTDSEERSTANQIPLALLRTPKEHSKHYENGQQSFHAENDSRNVVRWEGVRGLTLSNQEEVIAVSSPPPFSSVYYTGQLPDGPKR